MKREILKLFGDQQWRGERERYYTLELVKLPLQRKMSGFYSLLKKKKSFQHEVGPIGSWSSRNG
jgi:hypothetical protein